LPHSSSRLALASASMDAHGPSATVHSRLLKFVGKQQGFVGVRFRRPARNGSPRSAKRDGSESLCFSPNNDQVD
ncbi:hypothetical protein KCU91_g126, partial [Aureobasidium melanogenum]